MSDYHPQNFEEIHQAFLKNERVVWVRNFRVACIMAFIFMPAGSSLDAVVYPQYFGEFFRFRLICSALLLFIWWFVKTPIGLRHYRLLGLLLPALPTFFISLMIYKTTGAASPYYAGLNLVLLGAAIILRWTFMDSLLVFLEVLGLYLVACLLHGSIGSWAFFNNAYFIFVTGVFVVIGSHFYNQLRFREFAFSYELDKNRLELEETNRRLVELDRLKGRFFANISHELRTPVTLILSPLETLIQSSNRSLDGDAHEMLITMQANGLRLLKLVNDLLDLIRLESGRMDIKADPLEVAEFVKGLASAVRQVAENKEIKLETFTDPQLNVIAGDRDKLEKMVLNLLFNALKFTPLGGRIELRAEKQDADLVFIVSDTGIGIAEKNLPFVFDRFWQADGSSQRKHQGVGIGLALVKELAEMQKGSVSVKSTEGKGTTFEVRLPYKDGGALPKRQDAPKSLPEDRAAASEEWLANLYRRAEFFPAAVELRGTVKQADPVKHAGRPVVLIVDDEPDMRQFLRVQLRNTYDILEAVDGLQALEKSTQLLPDIILLDMMMPEMDGLDVCRELRKRTDTAGIPIILLTARADEETKFNALELGANDFLAKPFSSTELHARIRNLVESHDFHRKLSKQNVALASTIEQLKDTETQLVQSEKLASLGRMSAGIIHEINNPLNFAATGLFALRNKGKQLPPADRLEYDEILSDIEEGLKRVRNIVSDLRVFTHPEAGPSETVDVTGAVNAALRFLAGEWKDKVKMDIKIIPGQTVLANRNKLVHVLVNLIQNSLDALRHKKFENEEPAISVSSRLDGDRSQIVIRDNGMGIEKKHLDKIFDPFFTTKDVGEGMGLGLSICHRIMRGYGGHISVKTEAGRFCEFTLDFPTKAAPQAEPQTENAEPIRL